MKYFLKDIVSDTFTNSGGDQLYAFLDNCIRNDISVEISFKDTQGISSSFLNSSFGELINVYGFDVFKSVVKPVDLKSSQAEIIRDYLSSCGYSIK